MTAGIDRLLSKYEHGQMSRRDLLAALSTLAVARADTAAAAPAVAPVKQLNHVTLFVQNVQRSTEFYQGLFGMPLLTRQDPGVNLNAGAGFLGIYPAQNRPAGIDHICLGLEDFDADAVREKLKSQNVSASIRVRGDTKELYLVDPDNVRVQLQDVRYRGGVGPLGDRDPQ